ncbi:hypothetical protein TNCV_3361201 [Trichonephila clavipes]|nr:hypothetical protein TNCV_3361201 [Trichonephila clavipes]
MSGVRYLCSRPSLSQICGGRSRQRSFAVRTYFSKGRSVFTVQRAFPRHFDILLEEMCFNVDRYIPSNGGCLQRKGRYSEDR